MCENTREHSEEQLWTEMRMLRLHHKKYETRKVTTFQPITTHLMHGHHQKIYQDTENGLTDVHILDPITIVTVNAPVLVDIIMFFLCGNDGLIYYLDVYFLY